LSCWPEKLTFPIGMLPTKIPSKILKNVKMVDFVGYSANPKTFRRNQYPFSQKKIPKEPKFRSEQEWEIMKNGESKKVSIWLIKRDLAESAEVISIDAGIPFHYKQVEIKYSRFGVEDFDFGFYNKTKFGGLETHIQNSYWNALLQTLFFVWPLREIAKAHIRLNCIREPCLTCELGFLFRMLEGSQGVNCQASNFLRALALVPQGIL
jgi:PAB-dependent poly(A)-specific ribonuclease subunit 2